MSARDPAFNQYLVAKHGNELPCAVENKGSKILTYGDPEKMENSIWTKIYLSFIEYFYQKRNYYDLGISFYTEIKKREMEDLVIRKDKQNKFTTNGDREGSIEQSIWMKKYLSFHAIVLPET